LAEWDSLDRPKWYRDILQREDSKFDIKMLSTMSLPQIIALEHQREEMTFAKAVEKIKSRKKKNV